MVEIIKLFDVLLPGKNTWSKDMVLIKRQYSSINDIGLDTHFFLSSLKNELSSCPHSCAMSPEDISGKKPYACSRSPR